MSQYLPDSEVFGQQSNGPSYIDPADIFGGAPANQEKPQGVVDKTIDVGNAVGSGLGQGVMSGIAGVGTFIQAPIANTASAITGAGAAIDNGVTWLQNKVSPGSAEPLQGVQNRAQDTAQWAAESRAENVSNGNIVARMGASMEEQGRRHVKELQAYDKENNQTLTAQQKEIDDASGFVDKGKAMLSNPIALSKSISESIPAMAAGLGLSRLAAMRVMGEAAGAAESAATRAAAAGADKAAQNAAAEAAVKQVQDRAVAAASKTGIVSEAVTSGMQGREGVYQAVSQIPDAQLQKSPRYQEILAKTGDAATARTQLANELADQVPGLTALGTAAGSLIANKLFGGDATAKTVAGVDKMTAREFGKRTAGDTVEEGLQGIPEDAVQYGAEVQADVNKKYDPAGSLAQNMVAGFAMGGSGHGASYIKDNAPAIQSTYKAFMEGRDKAGEVAAEQPGQASTIRANAVTRPDTGDMIATGKAGEPSEAEKALTAAPKSLTSLDRVGELDDEIKRANTRLTELNTGTEYGPMFDGERAEVAAKAQELTQERESITKAWPKAVPGSDTSFSTEAGARVNASYALIEAGDLITSHDENLRKNPAYPQELQPRERDRAASELQVSGIVHKLDPARLGLSADAANGAPIVGADGLVESGNARTIAMKRVYQANGHKAEGYKQFLRDNAAQFGLTPEAVDAMKSPMLVRVRTSQVNRAEFARQANASTVAQMSPSEQAKSDANRIDVMDDLTPDDAGDFANAASMPFIRRFLAKLPTTEQAGMIDADGKLSTAGYTRVRNAVLAKAYGDSPVLMRMVESMDDNLRNVSKALLTAAPKVAQMRDAVKQGARFDSDITPDLMAAVEELSRLKDSGTSISDALAQAGMFGDKYSQETRDLLQFLADNIRRPRRMADFIVAYMDALESAGDPNQGTMFDEPVAPAKQELIKAAKAAISGVDDGTAQDTQRGDAGKDTQSGAQAGGEPANATGNQVGNEGAGAARPAAGGQEVSDDWSEFPKDSGTLGIPRAEMPQVKSTDRGALIQFLKGKGIEYTTEEVAADTLKPTQAEYAKSKIAKHFEVHTGERSVLVSSDGHVLDGHHQWMAALAMGEPVKVIRFDAPIRELLDAVYEFPGTRTGEGSGADGKRAKAVADFKDAMGELVMLATKHTRMNMVPPNDPKVLAVLAKLFDAAIKVVGTDMKRAVAYVKEQLKKDPELKTFWNKISSEMYQRSALDAVERMDNKGMLFEDHIEDVRAMVKPKVDSYDMKNNYKPKAPSVFIPKDVLDNANKLVKKYFTGKQAVTISEADRAKANAALTPTIEAAKKDKPAFDQSVVDIAKEHGIGQMIPPLKRIERAAEKVVLDYVGDVSKIADILRATVVVNAYEDAGKVIASFVKKYGQDNISKIKNKTGIDLVGIDNATKKKVKDQDRKLFGGYSDVSLIVKTPGGVLAEVQINVPSMLAIKDAQGHELYEAARTQPDDSDTQIEINAAMATVYDAAFSARNDSAALKNSASVVGNQTVDGPRGDVKYLQNTSDSPPDSSKNQRPSGYSTQNASPSRSVANAQPDGNLSGSFIKSPLTDSVAQQTKFAYTDDLFGEQNANSQYGDVSAQGARTKPAQTTDGAGQGKRVRERTGGPDQLGIFGGNDAGPNEKQVGQAGSGGVRSKNEDGARTKSGDGNGKRPGVPAGREIPPKSGLNYEFGDNDLTYEGSWRAKAEQNIAAIELLRKLEADKRQATREEQAVLAKFNGWGAGEIANALFGPKLDKVAKVQRDYNDVIAAYDKLGRDYMNKGGQYRGQYADNGYYQAADILRSAGKLAAHEYPIKVTRAEVEAVKPSAGDLKWLELRDKLKALLSKDEWAEASRSTQYAHYTSKSVVKSMWSAMERMGFKGGSILEPGAGIGVFPGLMPSSMANNSTYTGIEFDGITGGVLQQLFPDERILVESFVDTKLPKNFYDVAIGNPPFSATKILGDPEYAKSALSLHDYFFAKSIDRVKPGGLVMYVTSRFTMDKLDDKARQYLVDRADLVGAIRLPQTAFQKNAGTEVVTDVIFLRKKVEGQTFEHAQKWLGVAEAKDANGNTLMVSGNKETDPDQPALINEYFAAHPEMVLGTHSAGGSMYKNKEYTVEPLAGDIEAHFAKAVQNLPSDIYEAERGSSAEAAKVREIDFNPKAKKEGNYYVTDAGVLMVREGGVGQRVDRMPEKDMQMLKDFVPVRDALKQAHYDQLNNGDWEPSLAALNKAYDAFVKKHGHINQFTTKVTKKKTVDEDTGETYIDEEETRVYTLHRKIVNDPDWTSVIALEEVNDDTGEIKKSAFLTDRVLGKPTEAKIDTPSDALLSSLNDIGKVDIPLIANRLGLDEADTVAALGTMIYEDPESGWQAADDYLSGNVKKKLDNARTAAKADARYERNIAALEAVQPEPKTPSEINVGIGMNWIPGEVYQQFLQETAGVKARVEFNQATKQWIVQSISGEKTQRATVDWGTDRRNVVDLLEAALTGRNIRIESKTGYGSDAKTVFDQDATEAANEKLSNLKDAFQNWVWEDADRTQQLVRKFNDTFNTTVPRSFDGRHLTLPGMSKKWNVFDHVKRGAWRIIQRGNTYLAHAVGSGKTFQMIISAMEQKRLGMIKKPMMVVPNHMLAQFAREWKDLYPAARLMVADENNFHMDNRRRFVSRVALSDLDGVIITQSAFKLLDLDPEFKTKMINEQLEYMRAALEEAGGDTNKTGKSKDPRIKQIEKQIENMEQKLEKAMSSDGKDTNVRFDELGVDFMYVDEAHEYRKLDFTTTRQVKGVSPAGSGKAFDLYMKSRYLEERTPGRSLVMASGTPVTNTMAELYTVQRFMDNQALVDRGIEDFDSWAAMFGREKTALEPNAAGKYEPVTRFNKFVNVPELTQMFREYADVLNSDHLAVMLGDKRPRVEGGSRKIDITPTTESYQEFKSELTNRVEKSKAWKPSPGEANNPDPIIRIIGDGRLAAIDMRFIDPALPSDPDSKLNKLIDGVIAVHDKYADMDYKDKAGNVEPNKGGAQMVFSDLGFGAGVAESRGFNARAWFEKRLRDAGVNMSQVAFMSDYKKSSAKLKLFKDVNAGRIRILIGSSKNMGTGVNAQQRLIALHHLDSPWFPADLEQREGRIIRQGNKNPLVQIYAYAAKGTYDENMWKLLASKQYFIEQALSGDANVREVEDLDSQSQYDLVAAMAADDPRVLQLAGARAEVEKLQRLYRAHEKQRNKFQSDYHIAKDTIAYNEKMMPKAEAEAAKVKDLSGDNFMAKAAGKTYTARADWAQALLDKLKDLTARAEQQTQTVGEISGYKIAFVPETVAGIGYRTRLDVEFTEPMTIAMDPAANTTGMAIRATNALSAIATLPAKMRQRIAESSAQMDAIAGRLEAPFPMKDMLADKVAEANELEAAILFDSQAVALVPEGGEVAVEPPSLSRTGTPANTGMDVRVLEKLAKRIKDKMPNMPKVNVLADPSEAPQKLRDYITLQDAWNDVEGAMHDGEFYLFANGLSDELRAEHVLAEHEAAHFGLRAIFGPSLPTMMNFIYNNNADVRRAAKEFQKRGKLSNAKAAEEIIVDIPTAELAKLKGWRKLVNAAREWLDAHGFTLTAAKLQSWLDGSLSAQEKADLFVAGLVTAAREHMRGTQRAAFDASNGNTMLSDTLADDIAKQEKWLTAEAKARGFKDIDELVDTNYALFEKLAKLWREKNPATNGVLLSRSKPTQEVFEKRIDALFAGGKPNQFGVKILDKSDILDLLKVSDGPIHLVESKVLMSKENHPHMTAEVWKKVSEWIENPAAVFESDTHEGRLVFFAPELVNGSAVRMIVDPRPNGGGVNLMINAYDAKTSPFSRWEKDGLLRYFDRQKAAPVTGSFQPRLAGLPGERGHAKILTEKNLSGYRKEQETSPDIRLSRRDPAETAQARAEALIQKRVGTMAPLNAIAKAATRLTGIDRLAGAVYQGANFILDRVPANIKAGIVSDYGVPEAVIDQRAMLQGRQRVQLRKAGQLIDKLSTLTRAESQVAYEWMNMDGSDPQGYMSMMQGLPEESVKVLLDVQKMIDALSKEAVALGQLPADVYERNKFAYLRRSYAKHTLEMTTGEKKARAKAITLLGDQYKGRGLSEEATLTQIKEAAPDWWGRKMVDGKADTALKGAKFVRLELRTAKQGDVQVRRYKNGNTKVLAGTKDLMVDTKSGALDGVGAANAKTKLREVAYVPVGEPIPAQYAEWDRAGTFEVRNVNGDKLVLWRDFTKEEREKMGEIDEARFAIAKTLHGMIHDVEVGRYLEWLSQKYAKPAGSTITGTLVEASERFRDTFAPDEWVQVPDTKITGTSVAKYGKLAGKYLPGPVWNDLRQTVNGQFKPLGEVYNQIQSMWKTSKTALSPGVHMNNVMSNLVMADWHDVSAGHVAKALRIMLAANQRDGKGLIGTVGNKLAGAGIADREAALEVFNRYKDSGGDIGSWATQEIAKDQIEPLLTSIEQELAITGGKSQDAQIGVMAALHHLVSLRFPAAFDAIKGAKGSQAVATEAKNMLDLYQAEDDVFRLAAWLKAKEDGKSDMDAGKVARTSFLDYHINAPWVNAMKNTGWPFISYTYRAVPMLLEVMGKRPHKLFKLMAFAGVLNALGTLLAGGDDDEERKLLPEEKAGRIWGLVPKLIRMPWNDSNGSAVYLDIRRFIPVGDVFDVGAGHSAVPMLPGMMPGGPLAMMGEIVLNKSAFTGKEITKETDTTTQKVAKMADYLWKAFAPNILGLPGTYATTATLDAANGKTDVFGREQSVAQAMASSFGVKLGSYPKDVMTMNLVAKMNGELGEIDANIGKLKRQLLTHQIDRAQFDKLAAVEIDKKVKIVNEFREKTGR